ncbi:MAG: TerD family protein [Propionibacterium sp.]|nr:TerD family protein [Propionibacterium sp.]
MATSDAPRRASRLPAGTKVALRNLDNAPIERVLFGATWDNRDFDVDMCAVLLDSSGRVPDKDHFLYRRNQQLPDRRGFVGFVSPGESSGPDRAQILLDLEHLSPAIEHVVVAFSAVQRRALLSETGMIKARAMDLDNGQTSYVYLHDGGRLGTATCLSLWALQRRGSGWDVVVHGTPYAGGPPAFARDHGVVFG